MHTYLPTEQKEQLRKEYLYRLALVFSITVLVIIICSIIFILPSYIVTRNQHNQAISSFATKSNSSADNTIKDIESEVKKINDATTKLSDGINRPRILNTIRLIDTATAQGIKIKSFEITYTASSTVDMRVGGLASTRDALVAFKKNIESNQGVARVELPVSDLAKSKELTFVMRIVSK